MTYKTVAVKTSNFNTINLQMPDWADHLRGNDIAGGESAYIRVPLIYRAARLRCDTLAGLPYHVEDDGKAVDWPLSSDLYNLLWYTEAGMLLYGHGEWLKRGKQTESATQIIKKVTDVMWLHTRYSVPWYSPGEDTLWFSYSHPGPFSGRYGLDQLVYFREFNPIHAFLPGPGAVQNSLSNAKLDNYLTRFASVFFEHGAMPVVMLSPDAAGPVSKEEAERMESWFRRMVSGVANAFRVIATRVKFNAEILTPSFKDMVIPELYAQARQQVAKSFGIRQTLLDDAANFATAKEDRLSFYEDTIIPRAKMYASTINKQLFGGTGLTLVFDFEELRVFQTDETQRGRSLYYLTQSGVPVKVGMDILGYELSDEQIALMSGTPVVPATGTAPASQPVEPTIAPASQPAEPSAAPTQGPASKALAEDEARALAQWQMIALKKLAKNHTLEDFTPYENPAIDPIKAIKIHSKLILAKTVEEVKAAFVVEHESPAEDAAAVLEGIRLGLEALKVK